MYIVTITATDGQDTVYVVSGGRRASSEALKTAVDTWVSKHTSNGEPGDPDWYEIDWDVGVKIQRVSAQNILY
jgi:hypothetical protein